MCTATPAPVVEPVLVASSGDPLLEPGAVTLLRGLALHTAVAAAKRWVTRAIETASAVGHGACR